MQLPGYVIPEEHIQTAAKRNQDGFGYAYINNGRTIIKKFLDWTQMAEGYYKDVKRHPESAFLMHWRYATNGKISIKNSHPFALRQGGALIHNGVLTIKGMPWETSDSRFLVNNVINKFPEGWENQPWWCELLAKYIGAGNKLAMIFDDNSYLIVNENAGHWLSPYDNKPEGIWYSNTSYKEFKPTAPTSVIPYEDRTGAIDLTEYFKAVTEQQESCCEWYYCDDCYEEIAPGEEHDCDIPDFVIKQLEDYRKGLEPKSYNEIVAYGRIA